MADLIQVDVVVEKPLLADRQLVSTYDDALHSTVVRYFDEAADASDEARKLSERDRDYVNNKQWTDAEVAALKLRGQQATVVNRIKPKVEFLRGLEVQRRADPKAFPRTPKHESDADAATDAIRYVLEENDFNEISSDVFEDRVVEGFGGVDVIVKPGKKHKFIVELKRLPWSRLFYDPHSMARNFSDARYIGQVIWKEKVDAIAAWPHARNIFEATMEGIRTGTYEDKPQRWADGKRDRIAIVEIWCKTATGIKHVLYTRGGIIEAKDSPYVDEDGEPEWGPVLSSAYVDRDGNRYGAIRAFIDIQDEINKRRSKALHLFTMRQVRADKGAVDDVQKAKRELAKPDGWVETNPSPDVRFEIIPNGDMVNGQLQLLQEAKNEIDAMGANAAMSGAEERDMSGRALQIRREGGMAEIGPIFSGHTQFRKEVYRKVWNRIRQYWDEEMWVRVTDSEENLKFVALNKKVTRAEKLIEEAEKQGKPLPAAAVAALQADPAMQQVVEVRNNVAELDVDIIVDESMDTITLQQEQLAMLTELSKNGAPIPPEAIIETSGIRNKQKILEMMKGGGDIPPQIKQQLDANAQQIAGLQQELTETKNKLDAKAIDLEIKRLEKEMAEINARVRLAELGVYQAGPVAPPPFDPGGYQPEPPDGPDQINVEEPPQAAFLTPTENVVPDVGVTDEIGTPPDSGDATGAIDE